jgi:hypothetical protein
VQRSTVPILYLPEAPVVKGKFQARTMSGPESTQLSDDMVYLKQNFGGVAMWPMPVQGVEADTEVYHRLQQVYFDDHALQICSLAMRLLLEVLIALLLVGGLYYAIWGSASGRRMIYLIVLSVVAGLAFADFIFLLFFDPALEWLKISNWPFVIVIGIVGVIALWSVLRPKVPKP